MLTRNIYIVFQNALRLKLSHILLLPITSPSGQILPATTLSGAGSFKSSQFASPCVELYPSELVKGNKDHRILNLLGLGRASIL